MTLWGHRRLDPGEPSLRACSRSRTVGVVIVDYRLKALGTLDTRDSLRASATPRPAVLSSSGVVERPSPFRSTRGPYVVAAIGTKYSVWQPRFSIASTGGGDNQCPTTSITRLYRPSYLPNNDSNHPTWTSSTPGSSRSPTSRPCRPVSRTRTPINSVFQCCVSLRLRPNGFGQASRDCSTRYRTCLPRGDMGLSSSWLPVRDVHGMPIPEVLLARWKLRRRRR